MKIKDERETQTKNPKKKKNRTRGTEAIAKR